MGLRCVSLLLLCVVGVVLAGTVRVNEQTFTSLEQALRAVDGTADAVLELSGNFDDEPVRLPSNVAAPQHLTLVGSSVSRSRIRANISLAGVGHLELRNVDVDGLGDDSVHVFEHCLQHSHLSLKSVYVFNMPAAHAVCVDSHLDQCLVTVTLCRFVRVGDEPIKINGANLHYADNQVVPPADQELSVDE